MGVVHASDQGGQDGPGGCGGQCKEERRCDIVQVFRVDRRVDKVDTIKQTG